MSRIPTGLSSGALSIGSDPIYTASDLVILTNLILTNTDSNIKEISIYLNRGVERLVETVSIPAGSGKAVSISKIVNSNLNDGDILIIESSLEGVNYDLSGWVISTNE